MQVVYLGAVSMEPLIERISRHHVGGRLDELHPSMASFVCNTAAPERILFSPFATAQAIDSACLALQHSAAFENDVVFYSSDPRLTPIVEYAASQCEMIDASEFDELTFLPIDDRELPQFAVFVSPNADQSAIVAAQRCGIRTIGLLSSSDDANGVDYPIPCNNQDCGFVALVLKELVSAVARGRATTAFVNRPAGLSPIVDDRMLYWTISDSTTSGLAARLCPKRTVLYKGESCLDLLLSLTLPSGDTLNRQVEWVPNKGTFPVFFPLSLPGGDLRLSAILKSDFTIVSTTLLRLEWP